MKNNIFEDLFKNLFLLGWKIGLHSLSTDKVHISLMLKFILPYRP